MIQDNIGHPFIAMGCSQFTLLGTFLLYIFILVIHTYYNRIVDIHNRPTCSRTRNPLPPHNIAEDRAQPVVKADRFETSQVRHVQEALVR